MAFDFVEALTRTQALRIAPPGEVFWYTSGTIGPYYINTHYLYGGPEKAEGLLSFINEEKENRSRFPERLHEQVRRNYEEEEVFRSVVDLLVERVRECVGERFDWISGGERRDWFFSAAVADQLGKPHLLIYKDLSRTLFSSGVPEEGAELEGVRTVHVADLVTEASSYIRAWIPAVAENGGGMAYSANVVDRGQGGIGVIEGAGVAAGALVRVDEELFAALRQAGHIDATQQETLVAYYRDPHGAMKAFLEGNPEFLRKALESSDERTATRARMLVEQDLYGLDAGDFAPKPRSSH
jgi:orotate phosphoribosyltransferase